MGPRVRGDDDGVVALTNRLPSRVWLLRWRRLPVAQFVAREFADRGARQFVDEIERRRNFVLAELAGEERLQFVERERRGAGAQFDKSLAASPR